MVPQGPARDGEEQVVEAAAAECEGEQAAARPGRIGWAGLLKRVFDIDVRRSPKCRSGELKIIAAIVDWAVIGRILSHLGLDPRPPPRVPARPVRDHAV